MINYVDTYEEQKFQQFDEDFELICFSSSLSHHSLVEIEQASISCVEQDSQESTNQQVETKLTKAPLQRRRPPKRIQYTYHKKKKRPAPKPIISMKEDGLKVCLVIQKPKSNAHPFSLIEDRRILELVLKIGPKFYKIAKSFPGKSVSMVKNRYYKYLRYRWDEVLGSQYKYMNIPFEDEQSQKSNTLIWTDFEEEKNQSAQNCCNLDPK